MLFYAIRIERESHQTRYYDITINDWVEELTPKCLMNEGQVIRECQILRRKDQKIITFRVEEDKEHPLAFF